jgi:hypothetical protein
LTDSVYHFTDTIGKTMISPAAKLGEIALQKNKFVDDITLEA